MPGKNYDAILVLGFGLDNGKLKDACKERIDTGAYLFSKGHAKKNKIIFSTKDEAPVMKDYAMSEYGLSKFEAVAENKSLHTATNLIFSYRDIMSKEKIDSAIITSSYWHGFRTEINAYQFWDGKADWVFVGAPDSREPEVVKRDISSELEKLNKYNADASWVADKRSLYSRNDDKN